MPNLIPITAPYVPPTLARAILSIPRSPVEPTAARFPAAVLFADISGFTPLAEALAAKGPAGEEELSDLLNRYFSRMIGLIEAEGGEVAKFSGDAITVLFPAPEEPLAHAVRRAYQAALAIQAAMAEFATLPTSAGPAALGMKVGIGAGEVVAMQVGGVRSRWEYVVAGEPVRHAVQAEGRASRGKVHLSPEAEAIIHPELLPPRALVQPDWLAVTDPAVATYLCRFVPGPVLAWIEDGLPDWLAVLRPMSVLFAGVSGLDYGRSEALGQLHRFLCTAQEVLYRYQGVLRQLVVDDKGTVLVTLFGAPTIAHEDDAVRAVRCALDLVRATHAPALGRSPERGAGAVEGPPLQVAVGVATGHLFAGPVGSETRREYTVVGDPVNLAARLMSRAGPGDILCDFDTYRQASQRLSFESLPPVRIKGKAGLIRVYRPSGEPAAVSSQPAAVRGPGQLVGRRTELARLTSVLDAVEAGQSRILILTGEAGIGKSRLVAELTHLLRQRGLIWLIGAGLSIEQQTPYRGWRDIFSYYFGLDGVTDPTERRERVQRLAQELVPDQLPRLPLLNNVLSLGLPDSELTASLDPALRQQSLVLLLLALLRAWTHERPLIVVLEDAHWLDSLSWELAVAIARVLTESHDPLLLVLVTRPLEEGAVGARHLAALGALPETETLSLPTLSLGETVALATARLGLPEGALPEEIARLVRERAGGNPFFAEEVVLTLRDHGLIAVEPDQAGSGAGTLRPYRCRIVGDLARASQTLPETVQGLILARMDHLPPERQLALKVGSVIGHTFAYRTLHYAMNRHTPIPDVRLRGHLDALAALDLTPQETAEPDPTYAFKHVIIQEVAYGTLLFAHRRALHRTVAEWYENVVAAERQVAPGDPLSPYFPLLAYHYRQAEDPERERYYAQRAGEQAAASFANAEAVAYLGRALELTPPSDRTGRYALLLAREKVYNLQGLREAQSRDLAGLQDLAEALADDGRRAELALRRAHYAEATGDYPAALAAAQAAVRLAQAGHSTWLEAAGHLQWGRALWRQGQHEGARQRMEQALAIARRAKTGGGTSEPLAVAEPAAAGPRHGEAGPPPSPDLRAVEADSLRNLGNVVLHQGDYVGAQAYYEQALSLCREIGDRPGESALLNNLGSVAANRGDYAGARAYYEQTLDLKHAIGDRQSEGLVLNNLGSAATNLGDYAGARTSFEQALVAYRAVGDRRGEGATLNNLGVVSMCQGDHLGARAYLEQALHLRRELGDRQGEGNTLDNLGIVSAHLGEYAGARAYLEEALRVCREVGNRRIEGESLAYLGLLSHYLGDNQSAWEQCQQALRLSQELGAHSVQGYALTFLGHALAELGDLAAAGVAYQQALEIRQRMGQTNLTMGPLAGLARVVLAQGDVAQAQEHIEKILSYLETNSLDGTEEPFRVYLTCARVLRASDDPRAQHIARQAYDLLQEQAAQIADEALQHSFLEDVAAHREIVRELGESVSPTKRRTVMRTGKAIQTKRVLQAKRERVFSHLTDEGRLREWLCDYAWIEARTGGRYTLRWNSGYEVQGTLIEVNPLAKVVMVWQGLGDPGQTLVTWQLKEKGDGTEVQLRQSGFGIGSQWAALRTGVKKEWAAALENLQSVLEEGLDLRETRQPLLGVNLDAMTAERAAKEDIATTTGAYITGVVEGGAAEEAGAQRADVIVSLGGREVIDFGSLVSALRSFHAGDSVEVGVVRGRKRLTLRATLRARPAPPASATPGELAARLREHHAQANAALAEATTGLSEKEAAQTPAEEEWSVKQILAHLSIAERGLQEFVTQVAIGLRVEGDANPTALPDRIAAVLAAEPTLAGLLQRFARDQEETALLITHLTDINEADRYRYRQIATITTYYGDHTDDHIGQIRRAVEAVRR